MRRINLQVILDVAVIALRIMLSIYALVIIYQCFAAARRHRRPEKPLVTAWHDPESLAHFRADIRISSWDRIVPGDAEIKDLEPGEYYLTVSIYASRDSNNFVTGACYLYFIIPEKD